ncbi:argininosuccinate lyase [Carboxydothermus islandicus]|uniref:Argininosuccinate lyase n=1 Tax=Carboxydothermus islandicus TaxID=661089 RepID=A0A1L8D099_9THEO|nr:argininosuccinate lyase [Carboxydothermus islandicus]GAV24557.1 argininosuccinate lyase [Carboxydothermus islandicus]
MKLWGGRFEKDTDREMQDFHASIHFDWRLYEEDIRGSIAHVTMLARQGIITNEEKEKIIGALTEILEEIKAGKVDFSPEAEDIHLNIETLLIKKIGDVAKKVHTGRSRNDQVALDTRLYVKKEGTAIIALIKELQETLINLAEGHLNTIMPGYTHLQRAQPVTLAHHLLAYFWMFDRDRSRFYDCLKRADKSPLGAGALAGTTLPLDRELVSELLGFSGVCENSLDAVSDRDYILEFLFAASTTMMHLSRFSEEIVLWNSKEFSFVEIDDRYATGSSMMPQKKNPDAAELIRGKTGRVYGNLMAVLTMMKGLPLAYNKDMQEDKEPLFDTVDTLKGSLRVFTGMLKTIKFNREAMYKAALKGFLNATDLAEYLVEKGVPFREAHRITGELVLKAEKSGRELLELFLDELKEMSPLIEEDIYEKLKIENVLAKRKLPGGPAPQAVIEQLRYAREALAK